MITMINAICAFHDIKTGSIELGCDRIQALKYVNQRNDITNPSMPQFDLLSATRNELRRSSSYSKNEARQGTSGRQLGGSLGQVGNAKYIGR